MWEIGRFDAPQTIKFARVQERHLLMLQTAIENENEETRAKRQKRKKRRSRERSERARTERKEC